MLTGLEAIIGAISEAEIQAGWDRIKQHQAIQKVLRRLGLDFDPQAPDFDYVYTYTLVAFGIDKPKAMVEFFHQPSVRQCFRRAFAAGDKRLAEDEIRELSDHLPLQELNALDVSPESLMDVFFDCFSDAVDRVRTVVEMRHEQKLDQIGERQSQILQELMSLTDVLTPHLPGTDSPRSEVSEDELYDSQIDRARDLIRQDKADAALSILSEVEAELRDVKASAALRFRLLTNTGASLLVLGRDEEAVPCFESALVYAPDDPKALSNAALAEIIKHNPQRAIDLARQALQIESAYPPALSVLIQALAKSQRLPELDAQTRSLAEQDVESRRSLAFALLETEEYEQAEKLLRLSVASDDSEPQDFALLAQAILGPIQAARWRSPSVPWAIPVTESGKLEEAETFLTQVVNAWKLIGNRRRFHSAVGLRVNARALQHKFALALEDCQQILVEDPRHQQALYNAGLLTLEMDEPYRSISYLEQCMDDPSLREQARTPLAVAYLQSDQPRNALNVLLEAVEGDGDLGVRAFLGRVTLVAQAAKMVGDSGLVSVAMMEKLDSLPKDNPLVLETLGVVSLVQDRPEESIEHLQRALELAEGNVRFRVAFELAETYYEQNEFSQASQLYATIAPLDRDTWPTRRYVVSLLNSGDLDQALDVARRVRGNGEAISVISEVEARVLEYIGDLEPAFDLYMDLAEIEPHGYEHFLRAASISVRRGAAQDAVAILEPTVRRFWNNPYALIGIAKIFASANRPAGEVLEFAYRARRLGKDEPEIHLAYVGLFMKVEDDPSLDLKPSEVGIGSSVQLSSEQETLWYTILGEEPIDREKREFSSSDPVAQKLQGHMVGEMIQMKEGPFEQLSYKITEIQSKYVRAFQETLLGFSTWFPDHQGLHRFQVIDGDISPLFRVTETDRRLQDEMQDLYMSRQLTLEGFAQSVGRSIVEAWGTMTQEGNHIVASIGTVQEQAYHQRVAEASEYVTVDSLALITLAHLGLMDVLTGRFGQIYAAQAVVDLLVEEVERLRQFGEREYGVIGRTGERYVFERVPIEFVANNIQFLEQILGFVRADCQVMPTTGALELEQESFEQSEFAVGRSSIASALVAKDTGTVLYSDDFLLRSISRKWFSVEGCWTQPVLLSACGSGALTLDSYYAAIETLVSTGYYYVSLNAQFLMHVLAKNQWVVDSRVEKAFAPLGSISTETAKAVRVIAELIRAFWPEPIPHSHKQHTLDLCLRTLATNRDREIVVRMLRFALQEQFSLLGHQLEQVSEEVAAWFYVHRSLGI